MSHQSITNPLGAGKQVSDFRTFKDSAGETVGAPLSVTDQARANATIAAGEVLMFVAATATVPQSVTPMTAAGADNLFAGVAVKAATAGNVVTFVVRGFAFVDVAAETTAFGTTLEAPATTTGKAEVAAAEPTATTIVGTVIGVALAAKNSSNLAPAIIRPL